MALSTEDKAVVDEVVATLKGLKEEIATSTLMRSTGASRIHNELLPAIEKLERLETAPTV